MANLARVRSLAEALHRIDQAHLRHDNPHGQYHGYGELLLTALDATDPQDRPGDVATLTEQRDQLAALVDEILREFTVHGHPGREAVRTPWLSPGTVQRWRRRRHELRPPDDLS